MNIIEIQKAINNHFQNFIYFPDSTFQEEAFDFLSSKSEFIGVEYRFLYWLDMEYGYKANLQLPKLTQPTVEFDFLSFEKSFLDSSSRKQLFKRLELFVKTLKARLNLKELTVIIGGSFTDSSIESPNDIDLSIIIPSGFEEDINFNEIYLYSSGEVPEGIDVIFLPESLDTRSFKIFSRLMCLGNKAKYKDKNGFTYSANSFELSDIIRFKL